MRLEGKITVDVNGVPTEVDINSQEAYEAAGKWARENPEEFQETVKGLCKKDKNFKRMIDYLGRHERTMQ